MVPPRKPSATRGAGHGKRRRRPHPTSRQPPGTNASSAVPSVTRTERVFAAAARSGRTQPPPRDGDEGVVRDDRAPRVCGPRDRRAAVHRS